MAKTNKVTPSLAVVLGRNIRVVRKKKELTQNHLAQELGVEVETISRYERGVLSPSLSMIEKMCEVLDVNAWMLFSDGVSVPDGTNTTIADSLAGLSARDRNFICDLIQVGVEYIRTNQKKPLK